MRTHGKAFIGTIRRFKSDKLVNTCAELKTPVCPLLLNDDADTNVTRDISTASQRVVKAEGPTSTKGEEEGKKHAPGVEAHKKTHTASRYFLAASA